jgi:hypothetical protein
MAPAHRGAVKIDGPNVLLEMNKRICDPRGRVRRRNVGRAGEKRSTAEPHRTAMSRLRCVSNASPRTRVVIEHCPRRPTTAAHPSAPGDRLRSGSREIAEPAGSRAAPPDFNDYDLRRSVQMTLDPWMV